MELEQLVRLGLFPSAAIVLECSQEESVKRLTPEQMKKWHEKQKKKNNYKVIVVPNGELWCRMVNCGAEW